MGGSGSGSWYRWNKKSTTGDFHQWNITKLVKEGAIKPFQYRTGSWQWFVEEYGKQRILSTIGYTIDTTGDTPYAQVRYQNKQSQEEFDYKIKLTTTSPQYGGKRWWFICPINGCGRRVGVLYMGNKYFACRHCYNVVYESQHESPPFRLLSKAQKIHKKLGGNGCIDDYIEKPKGMHLKTFKKKVSAMNNYHDASMVAAATKFGSFFY